MTTTKEQFIAEFETESLQAHFQSKGQEHMNTWLSSALDRYARAVLAENRSVSEEAVVYLQRGVSI